METIATRIKEERSRLGMNQEEFAGLAGLNRTAQVRYEKGERHPDAKYLEAVAAAGVDVQYVITGVRQGSMDAAEAELLARFRAASKELRAAAVAVLGSVPAANSAPAIQFGGDNLGQVMSGTFDQSGMTFNVGSRGSRTRKKPSK